MNFMKYFGTECGIIFKKRHVIVVAKKTITSIFSKTYESDLMIERHNYMK